MSLINQMLIDLEARGANNTDAQKTAVSQLIASDLTVNHHKNAQAPSADNPSLPLLKMSAIMLLLASAAYVWTQNSQARANANSATQPATLPPSVIKKIKAPVAALPEPANLQEQEKLQQSPPLFASQLTFTDLNSLVAMQTAPAPNTAVKKSLNVTQEKNVALATLTPEKPVLEKPAPEKPVAEKTNPEHQQLATLTPVEKPVAKPSSAALNNESAAINKQVRPPQKSANFYRQALAYLQQGRVAEAIASLNSALEANPANHDARQTLAGLLLDNQRADEATTILAAGLVIAPEQNGFRVALARLQVESGDTAGALNTLEQGLAYAQHNADYQSFLAMLLQRANRHEEAISHYNIALSQNTASHTANTLIGLGISLQAVDQLSESQAAFARAQLSENLSPELAAFVEQRIKQISQRLQN